jgi:MtN3 and saliva related transmembrane protein
MIRDRKNRIVVIASRGCEILSLSAFSDPDMSSPFIDMIGASGAALTTLCWVPQAVKIIRDKETRAISLPGTILCTLGILLWLIYGVALLDAPLIGSSAITFAMMTVILVLKVRHG